MAISFPLSADEFVNGFGVSAVDLRLQDNREYSGLGSGKLLQADLASPLWGADVQVAPQYNVRMARIDALVNALIARMGTFFLYPPAAAAPIAPLPPGWSFDMLWLDFTTGTYSRPATPVIKALPNAYSMSVEWLAPGQAISTGDYLAFDYGAPVRRAFHQVIETVTAGLDGVSPVFEVTPFIEPGATVGATVYLLKPAMKCTIVPGSYRPTTFKATTKASSFSVIQEL